MEKYFDEFTANWNLHLRYFVLYWNFGLFVYTQNLNFTLNKIFQDFQDFDFPGFSIPVEKT